MKFVFDLKCIIIRQPMLIFKKGEVFLCSITRFLNYFEKPFFSVNLVEPLLIQHLL